MTLLSEIAAHCRERKDTDAIIGPHATWTFGQMGHAITSLASKIAACVPQAQPVAACCSDPALQIAAVCAAMLAGRPFLSVDGSLSAVKWAELAQEQEIHFLCSDRVDLPAQCAASEEDFRDSGHSMPIWAAQPDPQSNCGFLMTSGSSARPKLVALTNAQLNIKAKSTDSCFSVCPEDVLAMTASLGSTAGLSSALKSLRSGARLLVLRPGENGLQSLRRSVRQHGATILFCSPTLLRALMAKESQMASSLRIVRVGGEILYTSDVERFRIWAPDVRLVNHYGLTETVGIAQGNVDEMVWSGTGVPVGRPNDLGQLRFVDEAGRDVATGGVGRILFESQFNALGYRGDAALSDAAFTPTDRGRTFFSSDLGRMNEHGFLEIVGRAGRAVNVGGTLIHLDFQEDRLRAIPGVAQAAVLDKRSANGLATVLVAFVELEAGYERNAIQTAIRGLQPSQHVPRVIYFFERLPETGSGKIDREALRSWL